MRESIKMLTIYPIDLHVIIIYIHILLHVCIHVLIVIMTMTMNSLIS